MSVALGSGTLVLPANVEAAADITPGSLRADGSAVAGFGKRLAIAEHNALFAADCWSPVSAAAACCAACGAEVPVPCARNPAGHASSNANVAKIADCFDRREIIRCSSLLPWFAFAQQSPAKFDA